VILREFAGIELKNKEIADIFSNIAAMLGIDDSSTSKFEIRAYQRAALTIEGLQEDLELIYRRGGINALMELPGIGKGLAQKIEEYLKTGKMKKYEEMRKKYPIDFVELAKIEGLGAKKIGVLYKKLGVKDVETLKDALEKHKVRELAGFGAKSEEVLADGIKILESSRGRLLLGDVLPEAESIVSKLAGSGLAESVIIAGSIRRMRETVGDIDILALSKSPEKVMDFFSGMDEVKSIISKGPTKTTVWLKIGTSCDLRVIEPSSFGAAIQYFTGSKNHNIGVRTIAVKKGYKLNEYGLFEKSGRLISSSNEETIYAKLGMEWMPPEMREDRGEIKLAQEHRIPDLIQLKDLLGDMHTHTKETDGMNTLEEMAAAAGAAGLAYFATTNHTKSLRVARGMDEKRFEEFFRKVDSLNEKLGGKPAILKGAEVDILKDGSLDLGRAALEKMDCVVAAVHSNFSMSYEEMTARVGKALDTGLVNILAHPTGRVINQREPYKIDLEKVAESAVRNMVALEVNSYPSRLDLNDTNILSLRGYNVMFSVDSDGHNVSHFGFLRYGIGTARRGWLTKEKVINTMPLEKTKKFLAKKK
jgi:DNA polymerase (family 10)